MLCTRVDLTVRHVGACSRRPDSAIFYVFIILILSDDLANGPLDNDGNDKENGTKKRGLHIERIMQRCKEETTTILYLRRNRDYYPYGDGFYAYLCILLFIMICPMLQLLTPDCNRMA